MLPDSDEEPAPTDTDKPRTDEDEKDPELAEIFRRRRRELEELHAP